MEVYFSTFDIPLESLSKELTVFYDELGNIKDVVQYIVKKGCPVGNEVDLQGYAKKPSPGFCDWCSGKNMHFDIQDPKSVCTDGTYGCSPFAYGEVIKYERIPCPSSSSIT